MLIALKVEVSVGSFLTAGYKSPLFLLQCKRILNEMKFNKACLPEPAVWIRGRSQATLQFSKSPIRHVAQSEQ